MHRQNPDVTGMRDLPPLREPAHPPRPVWTAGQSTTDFRAALEQYDENCAQYEINKSAYNAERAKRQNVFHGAMAAMAKWKTTFPKADPPTDMWPADLSPPTPEESQGPEAKPDPIAALTAEVEGLRAVVASLITDNENLAATAKPPSNLRLNLTVDGEKLVVDGVNQPTVDDLIRKWGMAINYRENGGRTAKVWRNGHCYSERGRTLAAAVYGLVTQLEAASATKEASGYIITGDTKGTTTVMCSMTVTGDTVLISTPTADDMQALTLACYNAEHHPSIIIDGKNPPIFARIVAVECKHPDGPSSAECTLTLKRSTAAP